MIMKMENQSTGPIPAIVALEQSLNEVKKGL